MAAAATDAKRSNSLTTDRKRSSIHLQKGSFGSEASHHGKMSMKQFLTSPSQSHSRMTPGGQMFLCIMGLAISVAICVWLAGFSRELGWRRVIFSGGAAFCAILFAFLAFMTIRRAKHPQEPESLPDLSHRRSTIGARMSKKSASSVPYHDEGPTQVLVIGDKTRPSLTLG